MHKHYTRLQSSCLLFFSEAAKNHVGSSLTIALYCQLIIKAGCRNQLPAVKNIYNCKYYISAVEEVNTALWKCLLYRSAHQQGESENIILPFSAAQRFADPEHVFLRYRLLPSSSREMNLLMNERSNFYSNTATNTLLPLISGRMQLKEE